MSAHKLTPEQKIISDKRKKEYQKKYHLRYDKELPIELKRIYRRNTMLNREEREKEKEAQITLKKE